MPNQILYSIAVIIYIEVARHCSWSFQ